ncbi:hypothetical protein Bca101_059450 [Brassica carinata]
MDKPFDYHFGLLSTKELIVDDPRKVPFEEIRINEFRGWFYDEYDPGDPVWQEGRHIQPSPLSISLSLPVEQIRGQGSSTTQFSQ